MGKIRYSIHPTFFLFGLYFALTGKVFSFVVYTIVAVTHELGHSIASARLGYELKRIVLMPYGAVIRGEKQCFSYFDEVRIAIAGPLVNFATAILLTAVWWVFPEAYPYTELAVSASLTIAIINLLPAFPLDGGRILLALLSAHTGRKTALMIVRFVGIALSTGLFVLFVYSCFNSFNPSLMFFASFMFFGNVFVPKTTAYARITSYYSESALKRGKCVKRIAVNGETLVKDLYRFIENGYLLEIEIAGKNKAVLSCERTAKLIVEGDIYSTVADEAERLFFSRAR